MSSAVTFILKVDKISTAAKTRILQDSLITLFPTPLFFPIKIPSKLGYLAGESDKTKSEAHPQL